MTVPLHHNLATIRGDEFLGTREVLLCFVIAHLGRLWPNAFHCRAYTDWVARGPSGSAASADGGRIISKTGSSVDRAVII